MKKSIQKIKRIKKMFAILFVAMLTVSCFCISANAAETTGFIGDAVSIVAGAAMEQSSTVNVEGNKVGHNGGRPTDPWTTTVEPTTVEPTTVEPTTVEPTTEPTEAPTTVAPTTVEPTTVEPTEAPTTEAPTTVEPTTVEPTTVEPTTEPTEEPTRPATPDEPVTTEPTTPVEPTEPVVPVAQVTPVPVVSEQQQPAVLGSFNPIQTGQANNTIGLLLIVLFATLSIFLLFTRGKKIESYKPKHYLK